MPKFSFQFPVAVDKFYKEDCWVKFDSSLVRRIYIIGSLNSLLLPLLLFFLMKSIFNLDYSSLYEFNRAYDLWLMASFFPLIITHEICHAATFPDIGLSSDTTLGFLPSKLMAFAYYSNDMSKKRQLVCALAPFIIMTVLPVILCFYNFNYFFLWIAILNASFSGVDVVMAIYFFRKLPPSSFVRGSGWDTFYRVT